MNQFAFAGIFTVVAAFFNQLKSFIFRLVSFFIRTDTITQEPLATALVERMLPDLKLFSWGNRSFANSSHYADNVDLWLTLAFSKSYFCRYKRSILHFSATKTSFSITYVLGTFDISSLMAGANKDINQLY
jgi:hypothetical protein